MAVPLDANESVSGSGFCVDKGRKTETKRAVDN